MDQAYLEKMNQAQEVVDSLESEIKERKKRDTKMKDLANCEDNIYYLQVRLLGQFSGGCSCSLDLRDLRMLLKRTVTIVESWSATSFSKCDSQTCESMSTPLECGDLPTVYVNLEASFDPVRDTIQALRERIEDLCNQELCKITKQGGTQEVFLACSLLIFNLLPWFPSFHLFSFSQRHHTVHTGKL